MERMWIKAGKVSGLQWGESVHLAQIVACGTIFYVLMDKVEQCKMRLQQVHITRANAQAHFFYILYHTHCAQMELVAICYNP